MKGIRLVLFNIFTTAAFLGLLTLQCALIHAGKFSFVLFINIYFFYVLHAIFCKSAQCQQLELPNGISPADYDNDNTGKDASRLKQHACWNNCKTCPIPMIVWDGTTIDKRVINL